jgi:(heptosyl)LPS beta-1,4-glucosyltransferase
MTFSAVLAVRDEEQMLEGALRLLDFCNEIIVVVDDRTTDRTEEIARQYTALVYRTPFRGFGQLKNAGVERATGDWIVFCDADERVTPTLAAQLQRTVAAGTACLAFGTPRVNFFWGRRMRWGGWVENHIAIARRDNAVYRGDVHELLDIPPEKIGWLSGERWHFSHRSIEENLRKAIHYGRLDSAERQAEGAPPVTVFTFLRVMARDFAWRMIRRTGWRDGMPGVIEGIFQPFAVFCAAVMLWERQQDDLITERYAKLERELAEGLNSARWPNDVRSRAQRSN